MKQERNELLKGEPPYIEMDILVHLKSIGVERAAYRLTAEPSALSYLPR